MKKELSCFVVLLLQILACFPVQASAVSSVSHDIKLLETCEAPPPDSLRVTVKGTHFMVLEWKPAFEGADHFLEVFEQTEEGDWELYQTYESVVTASKRVDGLLPGKRYRFKVATKCGTNDPSVFSAYIDDSTLILELTLGGRRPIEPQVKSDCEPLEYLNPQNEWVGYRISYVQNGALIQNFFEFVSSEENGGEAPQLRRFVTYNPIVAADGGNNFPTEIEPSHDVSENEYVKMGTVGPQGFQLFGQVDISALHNLPGWVKLCKAENQPWNESFIFEPMVAPKAQGIIPGIQLLRPNHSAEISVENPIEENIKIFAPSTIGEYSLQVVDQQGRVLFYQEELIGNVEVQTAQLPIGVFVFVFKTPIMQYFFKAIKIN